MITHQEILNLLCSFTLELVSLDQLDMGPPSATLNKRYNFDDRLESQAGGPNVADNDSSYSTCIDDDNVCNFSGDDFKDISEAFLYNRS